MKNYYEILMNGNSSLLSEEEMKSLRGGSVYCTVYCTEGTSYFFETGGCSTWGQMYCNQGYCCSGCGGPTC